MTEETNDFWIKNACFIELSNCDKQYKQINFQKFCESNMWKFDESPEYHTLYNRKYKGQDKEMIFKKYGVLKSVRFTEMKYYQKETGIDGPKHTHPEEPVLIIRHKGDLVLYNGYHRALQHISKGKTEIEGYILEL